MIYVAFVLIAALVVFLSIKLSTYVDLLDKTTNVSGAFIGGILLAAVTSLPELFTSLSATLFIKENSLVLGNILGSNLFNIAALAVILIIFIKKMKGADIGKHHILTTVGFLIIYALVGVAMFAVKMPKLGWINIVSPFVLLIYIFVLIKTPKTEEPSEPITCALSTKQIISRFIICAAVLIGASVSITYLTDMISTQLNLGKTFAGALLLGLTTSLPELVSTFTLCKRKNFNAATGNICGSNLFNFLILVIADILSFTKGTATVYIPFNLGAAGMQAMLLLFLGAIASVIMLVVIIVHRQVKAKTNKGSLMKSVSISSMNVLAFTCYILFLILSITLA